MTTKRMNKLYDLAAEIIQNPKPKHKDAGGSETFTIKPVAMDYKFSSDVLAETVQKYEAEIAALRKALQAVITQWDTPGWKIKEHTAVFIDAGRKALELRK